MPLATKQVCISAIGFVAEFLVVGFRLLPEVLEVLQEWVGHLRLSSRAAYQHHQREQYLFQCLYVLMLFVVYSFSDKVADHLAILLGKGSLLGSILYGTQTGSHSSILVNHEIRL